MLRPYQHDHQRTKARKRVETLSHLLDNAIAIPGSTHRIGYDAIIGLVPGIGDTITTVLSAYIVYEGYRLGARGKTIAQMLGNVALDYAIGLVPGLGDVGDIFFKANQRNLRLLGFREGQWTTPQAPASEQANVQATDRQASQAATGDAQPATAFAPRRVVANTAGC
jgi:hypothetical protein